MNIIDKIKYMIQNFRNRNVKQLKEGNLQDSRKISHSSRKDFVRKTREGVSQPQWNSHEQFHNTQPVQLVQSNNRRRNSHPIKYTGTRNNRLNAQRNSQNSNIKLKITAIAASAVLAASCISACIHRGYGDMTLPEIQECLSDETISAENLSEISSALEDDGIDIMKEKIANALDLKTNMKNDIIKLIAGNENAPTAINVLGKTYRSTQGVGVFDEERTDVMSDGLTAVVNSTARLQEKNNPASRTQLKYYVEQLKTLENTEITVSPNTYAGEILSADSEHENLLMQYSIDDTIQKNNNEIDTNDGFEIGD